MWERPSGAKDYMYIIPHSDAQTIDSRNKKKNIQLLFVLWI